MIAALDAQCVLRRRDILETKEPGEPHASSFALFDPAQTPVDLRVYLVAGLATCTIFTTTGGGLAEEDGIAPIGVASLWLLGQVFGLASSWRHYEE
jgi:hypothetical protein